jgi:hypothetical protein
MVVDNFLASRLDMKMGVEQVAHDGIVDEVVDFHCERSCLCTHGVVSAFKYQILLIETRSHILLFSLLSWY